MRDARKLLTAFALVAALIVSALPAAAQTGRVGGTVKDDRDSRSRARRSSPRTRRPSPSSFTATTDDKGRYLDHRTAVGHLEDHGSAPGFAPGGGSLPVRTIGAPNPPVDIVLAPGAAGPTGALAGVNTKELQGELQKAEELMNQQQYDAAIAAYRPFSPRRPL